MKSIFLFSLIVVSSSAFSQIVAPMDNLFTLAPKMNAGKTAEMVLKDSLQNYENFVALDVNARQNSSQSLVDTKKLNFVSKHQAEIALASANSNPVVALYQYSKYDSQNKGIGFCFGRAMFMNLYLASAGVNRANIKKAFVVGPMDKGAWGWHVTTIVESRNSAGKEIWLAIDPISSNGVQDVRSWYKEMREKSDDGKLRLFIGEAGKFGAGSSRYDERDISDKFYNNYFTDMLKWFAGHDVSRDLK